MHLRSKNYKITSIKTYSSKDFQQYQGQTQNVLDISSFDFIEFSIFNNSCTTGLNILKPPQCTPTHQGHSNGT